MYSEVLQQHIDADYSPTPPRPIPVQLPGETLKFCPEHHIERFRVYLDRGPFTEAECAGSGYQKRPFASPRSWYAKALLWLPQKLFPKWTIPDLAEPCWFIVKVRVFCPVSKEKIIVRFAKPYCRLKYLGYMIKRTRPFRPVLARFRRLRRFWFKWKLYARSRSVFTIISEIVHHSIPDSGRFMP